MPIAEILRPFGTPGLRPVGLIGSEFGHVVGTLVDMNITMQGDGDMRDANRLYDTEDNYALDRVARRVSSMWIGRTNVKVSEIASPRTQGRSQLLEEGFRRLLIGRR